MQSYLQQFFLQKLFIYPAKAKEGNQFQGQNSRFIENIDQFIF